jgi:hypothetical protein
LANAALHIGQAEAEVADNSTNAVRVSASSHGKRFMIRRPIDATFSNSEASLTIIVFRYPPG